MISRIHISYIKDKSGTIAVLAALAFPVVIGMAGVGLDASSWMMTRRDLQTASDAAAIAAAWEVANGYDEQAEGTATLEARKNGYNPDLQGELTLSVDINDAGQTVVSASVRQEAPVYFSSLFVSGSIFTATSASAALIEPGNDYCMLALSEDADAAFTAVGTADIISPNCGIAVNSDSDSALDLTGFVTVDVDNISIVGNYEVGSNVEFNYNNLKTRTARKRDPYEDLEVSDHGTCTRTDIRRGNSYTNNATLSPGTYCGGISISGNTTVTFQPGVYYIDGDDLKIIGNGAVIGEGVTFILTNSNPSEGTWANLNISGGRSISFSAPAEGEEMEGIVFFQDRNAPEGSSNTLLGSSSLEIDGAMYFPTRSIDIGGNHSSDVEVCTRLIAQTIRMHGTPSLGDNCDGKGARNITDIYSVRLIL